MTEYKPFGNQNVLAYILADLNKRVKRDISTKIACLCVGVSAYIDPMNLFLKGESSVGKSYNVVQALKYYFPNFDLHFLAGLSPKALVHLPGVIFDGEGKEFDTEDKPEKPRKKDYENECDYKKAQEEYKEKSREYKDRLRKSYKLIDLSNKILVFLDAPELETLNILKPLLSHDDDEIEYTFTDKTSGGQLRSLRVVLRGHPAAIFLTVDKKYVEEFSTRSFTITPESDAEKYKEANKLTIWKKAYPWKKLEESKEAQKIREWILFIRSIFKEKKLNVAIPFLTVDELYPHEMARDMRDFTHLTEFIESIAALNMCQRVFLETAGKFNLLVSAEDLKAAFIIFSNIFETTRTGTDQKILDFYHKCVNNDEGDITVHQFTTSYNIKHPDKKPLSEYTIRQYLNRLHQLSYVDKRTNPNDRREVFYEPLVKEPDKLLENTLNFENKIDFLTFLEKGFEKWRTGICKEDKFYKTKENSAGDGFELEETTIEEAKTRILCINNEDFYKYLSKPKKIEKSENKAENTLKEENKTISNNSSDDFWRNITESLEDL